MPTGVIFPSGTVTSATALQVRVGGADLGFPVVNGLPSWQVGRTNHLIIERDDSAGALLFNLLYSDPSEPPTALDAHAQIYSNVVAGGVAATYVYVFHPGSLDGIAPGTTDAEPIALPGEFFVSFASLGADIEVAIAIQSSGGEGGQH